MSVVIEKKEEDNNDKHKYKKMKNRDHAHIREEWDSNSKFESESDSDSSKRGIATVAIVNTMPIRHSLFGESSIDDDIITPKCFMVKSKKDSVGDVDMEKMDQEMSAYIEGSN
ncbi:hypothetical protein GUJ93_ZPchr0002g26368 [Zizania palustris]|uniref:Uncharacterized protein n=1 Tax=Zizania palustris TaxID=103762 RepID=A0A8J5RZE4_ZIZPA|nr:hypothetical protein GUJ93_ZPchr0002g26368 [Zizania palustris]